MATMNEKRQRFIRYYKEVNNAQEVVMRDVPPWLKKWAGRCPSRRTR